MGSTPATQTWKQLQNAPHCKPIWRCMLFTVWWATTGGSSKDSHTLLSPLVTISLEKRPAGNQEWLLLTKDAMEAFKALKQACMTAPILVFADYTKWFQLETDTSKDGLGVVFSQQADGWYHPTAYSSRALTPHKKNYHSTKLVSGIKVGSYRALQWAPTLPVACSVDR